MRLIARLAWLGEKTAGTYAAFVERVRQQGYSYAWAADAPRVAAESYQWFDRFADLPGVGVCCLELHRPACLS